VEGFGPPGRVGPRGRVSSHVQMTSVSLQTTIYRNSSSIPRVGNLNRRLPDPERPGL